MLQDSYLVADNAAELEAEDLSSDAGGLDESLLASDPMLHEALKQLYEKKLVLEMLQAQAEQERMDRSLREARAIDGIGEVVRRVHPSAYHLWGQDLGYECWRDSGFTKYFDRIAPETKVKCGGTKVQVGFARETQWALPVTRTNNPKFTKRYSY